LEFSGAVYRLGKPGKLGEEITMTKASKGKAFLGTGDTAIEVEQHQADSVSVYADTPEMLDEEFKRLPSDLGYWGERYTQALKDYLEAKAAAKVGRARVELLARETLKITAPVNAKGTPERITEGVVNATVDSADEVQEMDTREILAEVEMTRLKVLLDAIRAKRDCLIQLGANYRLELAHMEPTIRGPRFPGKGD
jgi:hypothetical protein